MWKLAYFEYLETVNFGCVFGLEIACVLPETEFIVKIVIVVRVFLVVVDVEFVVEVVEVRVVEVVVVVEEVVHVFVAEQVFVVFFEIGGHYSFVPLVAFYRTERLSIQSELEHIILNEGGRSFGIFGFSIFFIIKIILVKIWASYIVALSPKVKPTGIKSENLNFCEEFHSGNRDLDEAIGVVQGGAPGFEGKDFGKLRICYSRDSALHRLKVAVLNTSRILGSEPVSFAGTGELETRRDSGNEIATICEDSYTVPTYQPGHHEDVHEYVQVLKSLTHDAPTPFSLLTDLNLEEIVLIYALILLIEKELCYEIIELHDDDGSCEVEDQADSLVSAHVSRYY